MAKINYYHTRFQNYKNDIKNTWIMIKELINREKKADFPEVFQIDAIHTHDCAVIANNFNTFFASIGLKLASDMPTNNAVRLTRIKTPLCRLMCYMCSMNVVTSICASQAIFIIATARVLPKATQRELFRLGAYPRYSQSHY